MKKLYPKEFRDDVVAVARLGQAPITQIAKDFGISEQTLRNWLKKADVEDGIRPGMKQADSVAMRELRKRNRVLEQENEILRRAAAYFAKQLPPKMKYPLVRELAEDGIPVSVTCRVLDFSSQGYFKWLREPLSARDYENA